jgi:hypothetical protein
MSQTSPETESERILINRVMIGLRVTSDLDYRPWKDVERAVRAAVVAGHAQTPADGDVEQECFDMLWQWFTERRGAEDMRANAADGGLSAYDFKQMLDEHESNLLDALAAPTAAPDTSAALVAKTPLVQKIEAEARRYAEMYPQSSDGRNTFIIFADWVAALSDTSTDYNSEFVKEILAADAAPPEATITDISELDSSPICKEQP